MEFIGITDTTPTPDCECLDCRRTIGAASATDPGKPFPREGDASVCLYCGCLALYDAKLRLRRPSEEEVNAMRTNQPEQWAQILDLQRKLRSASAAFFVNFKPKPKVQ